MQAEVTILHSSNGCSQTCACLLLPDLRLSVCTQQYHIDPAFCTPVDFGLLQDIFTSLTGASKPHHVVDDKGVVLGYSHFGMLAAAR